MERRSFLKGLVGMLGVAVVGLPRLSKPRVAQPKATKAAILEAALRTPEGRTKLAMAMAAPLRSRLAYESIGRKVFQVQQIPMGA